MAYLILVRHGESDWNKKGVWAGTSDFCSLTEHGRKEAREAGEEIKDIKIDLAYVSVLKRAKETLDEIKKVLRYDIPSIEDKALNERDYGIYTGKNKWEVKKELGDEKFKKLRRSWDYPIPNGESLKQVYERVVPYYKQEILPKLIEGKNVLISAHGNSLRALIKYLENIPDNEIANLELTTGGIYLYKIDKEGKITSKEIKEKNENKF